ncbi:MAG: hypothetical protein K9K63_11460 [Desulfotignum sp.]|nr:hypothetical protein [Desulfotignum sp.]MCF8088494.1 hypothetical protein [Desulfotignum sp.]MCF8137916.1 hypothetical protein [Desulfotignum sp.]
MSGFPDWNPWFGVIMAQRKQKGPRHLPHEALETRTCFWWARGIGACPEN